MASEGCKDAFVAFVECVAAAVKDGSCTTTTTTAQPLPCLDAADSVKKCMEENAGKYAHTLDLIASGAGAGEGEADANNNANRVLVLELMKMQEAAYLKVEKAAAEMELRSRECKACKDAFEALEECVAAGGMTATTLPLPCLEAAAAWRSRSTPTSTLHAQPHRCRPAPAGEEEADAGNGKVGVTACQPQGS